MPKNKPAIGSITWIDLTIPNAEEVKNFYIKVIGWKPEALSMGDYNDFVMKAPKSGKAVAGVCHSRGSNSDLPPQWLMYITVANISKSIAACKKLGGKVLVKPKNLGSAGKYCVIQDTAGAVCALYESKK